MTDDPEHPAVRPTEAPFLQSLEAPAQVETWGCKHASGLLPIDVLLARARDTKATGPFVIEETSLLG